KIASAWGSSKLKAHAAEAARSLLTQVTNEALKADQRLAAARELIGYRSTDKQAAQTLLDLVTPATPPELAVGLLEALGASEAPETGRLILERLPVLTPSMRATGLGVVLSRPEWTKAFLDRAARGEVQLAELSLDQKQALAQHPNRAI